MALSPHDRQAILTRLKERAGGDLGPCPVCQKQNWDIEGYYHLREGNDPKHIELSASDDIQLIPCVVVGCRHCGYIRLHGINSLGLVFHMQTSSQS